jgi:NAD(P)H dehydrogenase (quinone)
MAKVAIVYFSGYGHTAKQAEAVCEGAAAIADVAVTGYRIDEAGELPLDAWEELAEADAVIYGSPTYMGGPAWQFKKFADASSKPWFNEQWKNKLAAGFTSFRRSRISGHCPSSTGSCGSEPACFLPIKRNMGRPI